VIGNIIGENINLVKGLKQHLEVVTDKIFKLNFKDSIDVSGLVGMSSRLIFLSNLSKYEPKYKEKCDLIIQEDIRSLFEYIAKNEVTPFYVDGLAGFGWCLAYLYENNNLNINEKEVFTELDQHIFQLGINAVREGDFDFFYGAIGYGNYLIQRAKGNKEVRNYLKELGEDMIGLNKESTFLDVYTDEEDGSIDFSISHGLSSLIVFFSNLVVLGLASKEIKLELKKCCDEILKHTKDLRVPDAIEKEVPKFSPLRWCHGELGIVSALAFASKVLDDNEISLKALKIAKNVASFKMEENQGLMSATICHGTLSVAHIFQKWHNSYWQSETLKNAATYWYQESNKMMHSKTAYNYSDDNVNYKEMNGILFGLEGMGLALISAIDPTLSDWEESILLY